MYGSNLKDLEDYLSDTLGFHDHHRSDVENLGPHVIVVDDFYDDPDEIRSLGLKQKFVQYSPPLEEQVGPELASDAQFDGVSGKIYTTAMLAFRGIHVLHPVIGFRYNPPWLKTKMEETIGAEIEPDSWEPGGDWWNGAFNLREAGTDRLDTIHHHYHPSNNSTMGWNGVVYLSPEVPADVASGTSFWFDPSHGKYIAGFGELFSLDRSKFEKVCFVPYKYNRLVLFRENVLHKVEGGFGHGLSARLTQSFFFQLQ